MYRNVLGADRRPDRYSAKNMTKPVNFICVAPDASSVSLVGDFNEWNAEENLMERRPDGAWAVSVSLTHGHHHYAFSVDGERVLDPRAQGVARDANNERVSLISVS